MESFYVFLFNHKEDLSNIHPCQELLDSLKTTSDINIKGKMLTDYFRANRRKNIDSLKIIIDDILREAVSSNSNEALGHCYFVLGWIEHDYNIFEKSLQYFDQSQNNFEISDNKEGTALALNGAGVTLWFKADYSLAFKKLLDASEIAEELDNKDLINVITANIGGLFLNLDLYEEAAKYFELALASKDITNINRAVQESNLGFTYIFQKKYDLAEKHICNAIAFCDAENHGYFKTFFLLDLGKLKDALGKEGEAKKCYWEAVKLAIKFNVPRQKAIAYLELVLLNKPEKNPKRNLILLEECLRIFRAHKSKDHEARALATLADIYMVRKDYQKAHEASMRAIELKTQIYNAEMINTIGVIKVQQERKENQIYKNLYNQINVISQIGQAITSTFNIKEIGKTIDHSLRELLTYDYLTIGLYSKNFKEINYKISMKNGQLIPEITTPIKYNCFLKKWCVFSPEGFIVNNVLDQRIYPCSNNICDTIPLYDDVSSFICAPMVIRNNYNGLIIAQSTNKNVFSEHHLDLFKVFAAYVGISLCNEKLFSEITRLASIDSLTNIFNRRAIIEKAYSEFNRHRRYNIPLSVAMLDIDNFKSINDTYSHAFGDMVIKGIAQLAKNTLRVSDYIGRLGGDEFLILMPNTTINEAAIIANRLLKIISEHEFSNGSKSTYTNISIGIARTNLNDKDIEQTINRADKALYQAKAAAGNKVSVGN